MIRKVIISFEENLKIPCEYNFFIFSPLLKEVRIKIKKLIIGNLKIMSIRLYCFSKSSG